MSAEKALAAIHAKACAEAEVILKQELRKVFNRIPHAVTFVDCMGMQFFETDYEDDGGAINWTHDACKNYWDRRKIVPKTVLDFIMLYADRYIEALGNGTAVLDGMTRERLTAEGF